MNKYEYMVIFRSEIDISHSPIKIQEWLNAQGSLGWELICESQYGFNAYLYLKRLLA